MLITIKLFGYIKEVISLSCFNQRQKSNDPKQGVSYILCKHS